MGQHDNSMEIQINDPENNNEYPKEEYEKPK